MRAVSSIMMQSEKSMDFLNNYAPLKLQNGRNNAIHYNIKILINAADRVDVLIYIRIYLVFYYLLLQIVQDFFKMNKLMITITSM